MASFLTLTSITIALTPKLCPQPHCQPHQDTPVPRHKPDLLQSPQPQLPGKGPCWLFKGVSPPLSGVARPGSGGPPVTTAPQRPSRDTQRGGLGLPSSWASPGFLGLPRFLGLPQLLGLPRVLVHWLPPGPHLRSTFKQLLAVGSAGPWRRPPKGNTSLEMDFLFLQEQ